MAWIGVAALTAACSMTPTATARSTIEQRLLSRSLERALARLDVSALGGKRVFVELDGLTPDQVYARALVRAELRQRGVLVVGDASEAEARIQIIASGLGVDQGETLIGIPATTVPVLSLSIPEIALFKFVRHQGLTEMKVYAYDRDGRPLDPAASTRGQSRYWQFTILVLIKFTHDDLDDTAPSPAGPSP
jgi:hypothetical protein